MSLGPIETRVIACEQRLEYLIRYIAELRQQIVAAGQAARTASSGFGDSGGGGSAGAYFCQPSGTVGGATGTWPTITPVSFTANVYSGVGGGLTLVATSATIWNYVASGLVASKTCPVIADGSGSFAVYTQSCS